MAQRIGVQVLLLLHFVVRKRFFTDHIEHIEPADRLQFLPQIDEHEFDQAFRLFTLLPRVVSCAKRCDREHSHHYGQTTRADGNGGQALRAALGFSSHQFVERHTGQAGDEFKFAKALAVFAFTQIGGDRLEGLIGDKAVAIDGKTQRLRKTFIALVSGYVTDEGFTISNNGEYARIAVQPFVVADFFVDPA